MLPMRQRCVASSAVPPCPHSAALASISPQKRETVIKRSRDIQKLSKQVWHLQWATVALHGPTAAVFSRPSNRRLTFLASFGRPSSACTAAQPRRRTSGWLRPRRRRRSCCPPSRRTPRCAWAPTATPVSAQYVAAGREGDVADGGCSALLPILCCPSRPCPSLAANPLLSIPAPPLAVEEYAEGLAFKIYLNEGRLITQGEVELAEVEECES